MIFTDLHSSLRQLRDLARTARVWIALATLSLIVAIALLVMIINVAAFGLWFQPIDAASLLVYCMLIAAAITMLSAVFDSPTDPAAVAVRIQPCCTRKTNCNPNNLPSAKVSFRNFDSRRLPWLKYGPQIVMEPLTSR